MTHTIWKFAVEPGPFTLDLPQYARSLTVQTQGEDNVSLWVLCSPEQPKKPRRFWSLGTGHDASLIANWTYIGTFQFEATGLVFHLFEEP